MRGLLANDAEWHACMREQINTVVSASLLRKLLCVILMFNRPSDPTKLVEEFVLQLGDDFGQKYSLNVANEVDAQKIRALVLTALDDCLTHYGSTLKEKAAVAATQEDVAIVEQIMQADSNAATCGTGFRLVRDELEFDPIAMTTMYREGRERSTPCQKNVLDVITTAVDSEIGGCFFVDAPGGNALG